MQRLLIVGLDGLEPSLAERWMDAGELPALAALRRRGAYMRCGSTMPPATFPAWTTCATGMNPGRHGLVDFTEMLPGAYDLRFVNASRRETPALWNMLSDAGARVCVLGVPGTWPAEPVNGVMASGFDSPVAGAIDPSFVYPREAFDELREWQYGAAQESRIGKSWHERTLPLLLDKIAVKEAIAARLLARERWDFAMVVFSESDTVGHHFWLFHDEHSPRHRSGRPDAILRVYRRLDAAVGALVEAMGDAAITVVSDHGFGGAGTGVVHLNNWLAERGHLRFSGSGRSWLKAAALRLTPQKMRGTLFRRFRRQAAKAEAKSRFGGMDWNRTQAYSEELNYFPSVRINLKGREAMGQVAPEDYLTFRRDLCAELEAWAPVQRALPRDEAYEGPCVERAPDILLELALEDGYSHSVLRSRGGPPFRRIGPEEHLGGKERGMNGAHRPEGVFFMSEPSPCGWCCLEDVAPTALACMGAAGPRMDGTSLLGPHPVAADAAAGDGGGAHVYTPAQEKELEERLRALGYFE